MPTFTGFQRRRATSRLVRVGDRVARALITLGGAGTIAAVTLVCAFLFWVVLPLLQGAALEGPAAVPARAAAPLLRLGVDEYCTAAWQLFADGRARAVAVADGAALPDVQAFDPTDVTAAAAHGAAVLLGRRDGSVQLLRLGFDSRLLAADALPPGLSPPAGEAPVVHDGALFRRAPGGRFRRQQLRVQARPPLGLSAQPIVRVDFADGSEGTAIAAIAGDGALHLAAVKVETNPFTEEEEQRLRSGSLPAAALAAGGSGLPAQVAMLGTGNSALLLWADGSLLRVDCRDLERPQVVERMDLLPDPSLRLTAVGFLSGQNTLLLGDSAGSVHEGFVHVASVDAAADGRRFSAVRVLPGPASPVTALAPSPRSRLFACGHADGSVRVLHGTTAAELAAVRLPGGGAVQGLAVAPKEDAVLAAGAAGLALWRLEPGHPEVTLHALVAPVWYEGGERPEQTWQAGGGSDDIEPKYGLWPLVFGTLKATFYCLLLGVPLALLAAIYTSEFLKPALRARVKPLLETMASLPSVVLGFLAALVFAPWIEANLLPVLSMLVCVPLVWLCGAQLFQALPPRLVPYAERWRLASALLLLPAGIALSLYAVGPALDHLLFPPTTAGGEAGLKQWLAAEHVPPAADPQPGAPSRGSAFGGWFLLLLPLLAAATALALGRWGGLRRGRWSGSLRFLLGGAAALLLAIGLATLLDTLGFDLRGEPQPDGSFAAGLVGTYVQRNALIVGFAMGFAVIPIVYTIAEDALSAVPEHLRAASLGAGATPWQTAVRIVLPTAMSGIFSAIMVGLGRAVGETMIVLMATGSTALLEVNPFNGFRTLSANIAIEMPEAVQGSTHYRILFLTAFVLFVMTFVLNTVAELVRQRFRKRAFQL